MSKIGTLMLLVALFLFSPIAKADALGEIFKFPISNINDTAPFPFQLPASNVPDDYGISGMFVAYPHSFFTFNDIEMNNVNPGLVSWLPKYLDFPTINNRYVYFMYAPEKLVGTVTLFNIQPTLDAWKPINLERFTVGRFIPDPNYGAGDYLTIPSMDISFWPSPKSERCED